MRERARETPPPHRKKNKKKYDFFFIFFIFYQSTMAKEYGTRFPAVIDFLGKRGGL